MIDEQRLKVLTEEFNNLTSINSSDEGGVVWGSYSHLKKVGWIKPKERSVIFATGIERIKSLRLYFLYSMPLVER